MAQPSMQPGQPLRPFPQCGQPLWSGIPASGGGPPPWSDWLTLADLDGGGVPDSDPGGILGSISEPSPGVISATINPDGTKRDGPTEGALFFSGIGAGYWGSGPNLWPTDGTGRVIIHTQKVSLSSTVGNPIIAMLSGSIEGTQFSFGGGWEQNGVNQRAATVSGSGGSGTFNVTSNDFIGSASWTAGSTATGGSRTRGDVTVYGVNADGTWPTNQTTTTTWSLPLQTDVLDPTRMRLGIFFGNTIATVVPYTVVARFRYAVITTPLAV